MREQDMEQATEKWVKGLPRWGRVLVSVAFLGFVGAVLVAGYQDQGPAPVVCLGILCLAAVLFPEKRSPQQ